MDEFGMVILSIVGMIVFFVVLVNIGGFLSNFITPKEKRLRSEQEMEILRLNIQLKGAEEKIRILRKTLRGEDLPNYPDIDMSPNDRILVQQHSSDMSLQNDIMKKLNVIEKNTLYSSNSPYNIWKDRK